MGDLKGGSQSKGSNLSGWRGKLWGKRGKMEAFPALGSQVKFRQ